MYRAKKMDKHGICILNAYLILPGAKLFFERMKEELAALGISLEMKTNSEIFSFVDGTKLSGERMDYDFVLYLDKDLYASYALEKRGVRLFNSACSIELCDDKMRTHLALAAHGIKMPRTISGPLNYSTSISMDFIKNVESLLSFPFVAKLNYGSLGENVYLLNNEKDFIDFETIHRYDPRLYQEFVSSSKGVDYRIIVIGGRFAAGMKRINDNGDFRSNIALGGRGEKVKIPDAFVKVAEKSAKILKLDYCGCDILIGTHGEPILCEVNSNAFITGIEATTGFNVAKTYALHIKNAVK
jgi:gamma-F420-2:alpha-L-glutamate ligase